MNKEPSNGENSIVLVFLFATLAGYGLGSFTGILYGSRYPDVVTQLFGWYPVIELSWSGSVLGVGVTTSLSFICGVVFLVLSLNLVQQVIEVYGDD